MIEYSQMFLWVALFIIFVVGEIISLGITSIWFAGGALAGFLASLITDVFWIQFAAFAVVSLVLLFFTRPVAKKYFDSSKLAKTNVDAMTGELGLVKEEVNNLAGTGVAIINGLEWTVRTESDNVTIPVNKKVKVKSVKGVTAIVEAVNN